MNLQPLSQGIRNLQSICRVYFKGENLIIELGNQVITKGKKNTQYITWEGYDNVDPIYTFTIDTKTNEIKETTKNKFLLKHPHDIKIIHNLISKCILWDKFHKVTPWK